MKYAWDDLDLTIHPQEFSKNDAKELLQFAVGGLLYTPATNTAIAQKIIDRNIGDIRSLCLCLEDAIGDDMVKAAEVGLKETLTMLYKAQQDGRLSVKDIPLLFVRVREPQQLTKLLKFCGRRAISMLTGFNLPKFDKSNCDAYIAHFKIVQAAIKSNLYIMPIIESKAVISQATRFENLTYMSDILKGMSDSVLNVRVGATDFCSSFGLRRGITATVYDMRVIGNCLADVVNVFGQHFVCSGPVWEYFSPDGELGAWSDGLKNELVLDRLNGFIGKTCIHPSQLRIVQANNIVTYEEYKDATTILGMQDGLVGVKKGFGGNKMNEVKPHTAWAKKIICLAEVYGVLAQE